VKIQSRVIVLAAWRKILKQVNFCDASELMPPFCRNIFQHIHFQPIVKQIIAIKFMKFYACVLRLHDSKLLRQMYSRRILSLKKCALSAKTQMHISKNK